MVLENDPKFFKSYDFMIFENYDKNCSTDTYDTIFLKTYVKYFIQGSYRIEVIFFYKVNTQGKRTLQETSVVFFGTDADIETNISTKEDLKLFIIKANELTKYFKITSV